MNAPKQNPDRPGVRSVDDILQETLSRVASIVGACHQRLGNPLSAADLDEVVQDTSLAAWSKRESFRGDSDIETWIFSIARNSIFERLRRGQYLSAYESELAEGVAPAVDPGAGPGTQADTGVARVIDRELASAGTTVRKICKLRALEGRTFVQIGEELDDSEARVKARFYRSLPQLQRRLRGLWISGAE